jgi:hypothetical protein
MNAENKMPDQIAAWRFLPEKADEWIHGGWSIDHDHKTARYVNFEAIEVVLKMLDGAACVERRGSAYFIREKLGLLPDEKPVTD